MTKHDFHPVICNHTQTKKDKNIAIVLHLTVHDEMCRGSKAILTLDRHRQTERSQSRASSEHNRRDNDHTGTPVRERELEYQSDTSVLFIHNSAGIYYCI